MIIPTHKITDHAESGISIASVTTGLGLHVAGKDSPHEVWEQWAAAHVVASVLFLVITGIVLIVAIDGPNSTIGHLHYLFGLLLTLLPLWHIVKRWKALVNTEGNSLWNP